MSYYSLLYFNGSPKVGRNEYIIGLVASKLLLLFPKIRRAVSDYLTTFSLLIKWKEPHLDL